MQCLNKLGRHYEAVQRCLVVLDSDNLNVKALFHMAAAHRDMHEFERAMELYDEILEYQPQNAGVLRAQAAVKVLIKEYEAKSRKMYKDTFA